MLCFYITQVARLDALLTRYKTQSEELEKSEEELKLEKRKLQREVKILIKKKTSEECNVHYYKSLCSAPFFSFICLLFLILLFHHIACLPSLWHWIYHFHIQELVKHCILEDAQIFGKTVPRKKFGSVTNTRYLTDLKFYKRTLPPPDTQLFTSTLAHYC